MEVLTVRFFADKQSLLPLLLDRPYKVQYLQIRATNNGDPEQ